MNRFWRSVLILVVMCLVGSTAGCGRRRRSEPEVEPRPQIVEGPTRDFDPMDGPAGLGVTGRDIPLGDVQPDMDRFFDPRDDTSEFMRGVESDRAGGFVTDGRGALESPTGELARILRTIQFAFDSYTVSAEGRSILNAIGAWMRANPRAQLLLEGHTCRIGSASYNMALGERRALAVREYLVGLGIRADRLATVSFGEEMPVDLGSSREALARNRRVEFKVRL